MANKTPEPTPQSVTFLTPDDLAPILTMLEEHAALLAGHTDMLADHESRLVVLEAAEPPEPVEPPEPPDATAPDKAIWDAHMIEWGIVHGDFLSTEQTRDVMLNHVYYDMARVMAQIAAYTGHDDPWHGYAKQATVFFRDQYVVPNAGAVPGYQNFTHGLRMDFERTGDVASKDAAILLSQKAAYAFDGTNPAYITGHERSREVAYAILSYINAEALGEPRRSQRAPWVTQSYDYLRQWQDTAAWGTVQIAPFMMGITAQALIADWEETQDTRCLPALTNLADWLWTAAYHAPTHAMLYQINPAYSVYTEGAPDLNMIIAPLYSWLYAQTGEETARDRFDQLLIGQANAYLAQGKQFNQNYWWMEGMRWREAGPA